MEFINSIIWHNSAAYGNSSYDGGSGIFVSSNVENYNETLNTDPLFVDNYNGDYRLSNYSPSIGAGTTEDVPLLDLDGNVRPQPDGSNPDMGAYENPLGTRLTGATYFIATTGSDSSNGQQSTPYKTIQHGINASWNGDTVLIAPGVYEENVDIIDKNIILGSYFITTQDTSFIEQTVINGGFTNGRYDSGIYINSSIDITCEIIGMKIKNATRGIDCDGSPIISNVIITENKHHGLFLSGSDAIIKHSRVEKNSTNASPGGSGFLIEGNSNVHLIDVVVDSNYFTTSLSGAIFIDGNSIVNMDRCVVSRNIGHSSGSGIFSVSAQELNITNSSIYDNYLTDDNSNGGGINHNYGLLNLDSVAIHSNEAKFGAGLWIGTATNTLINNSIIQNNNSEQGDGGGIYLDRSGANGTGLIMQNTKILNNHARSKGGGIFISDSNNEANFITNCLIENNTVEGTESNGNGGGGIYINTSGQLIIRKTTIVNNSVGELGSGGGVYRNYGVVDFSSSIIWANTASGEPSSITDHHDISINYSLIEGGYEGENNIDVDPFFCNPDNGNFELYNNSPCLGAGENGVDIGAFGVGCYIEYNGPVWHVATNGIDDSNGSIVSPFQTIQKGIDTAEDGDTVLVSPGTYVENINFNGKNIIVGSMMLTSSDTSYISSTIIDGNGSGRVINIVENGDSTAVLDGFKITNGLAGNGGGIMMHNTSPTLRNLIVSK